MSNFMYFTMVGALGGTVAVPTARRNFEVDHFLSFSKQAYAADPIGTHTLTLTNVVVGSRVFIQDQDKTVTHYDQIAGASTVVIPLQVYVGGSALNDWRIKVRKASSGTTYIPYETLMTATPGSSSIYVSQIPDE